MAALTTFIDWNRRVSHAIGRRLPQTHEDPGLRYVQRVGEAMNERPEPVLIVDVGAGKRCPFAHLRDPAKDIRIIGVDVSAAELEDNGDLDERRIADITTTLPFGDREVDCVVSRSVIEHLTDTEPFVRESYRVLEPGGLAIHLFPSRFAPFAVANRMLPNRLSKRLLRTLIPGSEGILGFPAHYDRCTASSMQSLHERCGFEVEAVRVSYYQSEYFSFFVPAYLLSAAYELAVYAAKAPNLAAYVLLVARKPS